MNRHHKTANNLSYRQHLHINNKPAKAHLSQFFRSIEANSCAIQQK